jgi:hypothetical protein
MMVTHASYSLHLVVELFSMGAYQIAPAPIRNNAFKLIDALASERAIFVPCIFKTLSLQTN